MNISDQAIAPARDRRGWLLLYLKGMGMGAADVVPGVSGGTIAFITGIYAELVATITRFDWHAVNLLRRGAFADAWRHVNGNFIAILLLGIGTSVLTLARIIHHLLETQAVLLAAFFMGLILASAFVVVRHIDRWRAVTVLLLVFGAASMWLLSQASSPQLSATPLAVFGGGAIAICAMILPGISGSFVLLLLGLYAPVIGALKNFEIGTIAIFAVGCACGLLAFSRLLSWLLSRFTAHMMSFLSGVLFGSLVVIWPWKIPAVDAAGVAMTNVSPALYAAEIAPAQPLPALVCAAAGLFLVLIVDHLGRKKPA